MLNVPLFLSTLPYMAKGLAGIFLVTLVIMLCIVVLNKATAGRK